jgi:hypothetical protein
VRLGHVRTEDLRDDARLNGLHLRAVELGLCGPSEHDTLMVYALAAHALRVGANPAALFAVNLRAGNYCHVAEVDVDAANTRIKRIAYGILERGRNE